MTEEEEKEFPEVACDIENVPPSPEICNRCANSFWCRSSQACVRGSHESIVFETMRRWGDMHGVVKGKETGIYFIPTPTQTLPEWMKSYLDEETRKVLETPLCINDPGCEGLKKFLEELDDADSGRDMEDEHGAPTLPPGSV